MRPLAAVAFSGGLDTSFCVVYLIERGYDVVTVTVDTGGFSEAEKAAVAARSKALGAAAHYEEDGRAELFERYLRWLVYGNVLRGQTYPLSVSAERVCQAIRVVERARACGAAALCHGSTGAGNDQVRFDTAFRALAPDLTLLTPIRELGLSRREEAEYLEARGFHVPAGTRDYSINTGMWGGSVGGRETLTPWPTVPDAVFPGGPVPERDFGDSCELTLGFTRGVPTRLDGAALDPVALIQRLNETGRAFGIGRGVHLGDTILGIKGRVGFEAPAAYLLIGAHRELEKLVLSGRQLFWKETLGNLYGALLHEGHYFDPLARDIEAFLASSQTTVTGEARLRLFARTFTVEGVRSPYSMMDPKIASYGESAKLWSGDEAAGFAKIAGMQQLLAGRARAAGDAETGDTSGREG